MQQRLKLIYFVCRTAGLQFQFDRQDSTPKKTVRIACIVLSSVLNAHISKQASQDACSFHSASDPDDDDQTYHSGESTETESETGEEDVPFYEAPTMFGPRSSQDFSSVLHKSGSQLTLSDRNRAESSVTMDRCVAFYISSIAKLK